MIILTGKKRPGKRETKCGKESFYDIFIKEDTSFFNGSNLGKVLSGPNSMKMASINGKTTINVLGEKFCVVECAVTFTSISEDLKNGNTVAEIGFDGRDDNFPYEFLLILLHNPNCYSLGGEEFIALPAAYLVYPDLDCNYTCCLSYSDLLLYGEDRAKIINCILEYSPFFLKNGISCFHFGKSQLNDAEREKELISQHDVDYLGTTAAMQDQMDCMKKIWLTDNIYIIPNSEDLEEENMSLEHMMNSANTYARKVNMNTKEFEIKKVIFNDKATIVYWETRDKTVVKLHKGETPDKEKAIMACYMKKLLTVIHRENGKPCADTSMDNILSKWIKGDKDE